VDDIDVPERDRVERLSRASLGACGQHLLFRCQSVLEPTFVVAFGTVFNRELLRTGADSSPFGSIDFKSLPVCGSPCG